MRRTKAEMLARCVSNSERRRIELTVPDNKPIGGSMQNANDLWKAIQDKAIYMPDQVSDEEAIALIRSRDKEIVEVCMLVAFMHGDENEKETMRQGFLSVLRDLG